MVKVFARTVHVHVYMYHSKIKIQLFQPMAKNPPYLQTLYVLSQVHLHVHCASLEQFLLCVFIVCEIILSVYTVQWS